MSLLYMYTRVFFTNMEGWDVPPYDENNPPEPVDLMERWGTDGYDDSTSESEVVQMEPEMAQTVDADVPKSRPELVETKENVEQVAIPTLIELGRVSFILSQELIMGMEGQRDQSHKIELNVLTPCLKKISKKLKDVEQDSTTRFIYYFKQKTGETSHYKLINLIVDSYQKSDSTDKKKKKSFNVITSYYTSEAIVKHRFGFNQSKFNQWVKNLSEIKPMSKLTD